MHDWRVIALSTPRLWSRIVTLPNSSYPLPTETVILEWRERSKQTPLSVFLESSLARDEPDTQGARFFLGCVRPVLEQSYRWKEAKITLPSHDPHMCLSELENLHLLIDHSHNNHFFGDVDPSRDASKLRRVTVVYYSAPFFTLYLPQGQLTRLSVRDKQSMVVLCIPLQIAPNLLEGTELSPPAAVQHPGLRDLSLRFESHVRPQFFDRLFVPSLCTLYIDVSRRVWSSPQVLSFLSQNLRAPEKFERRTGSRKGTQLVVCMRTLLHYPSHSLTMMPARVLG